MPTIVFLIDLSTEKIINATRKTCDYFGYSKDTIISMKLTEIFVPFNETISKKVLPYSIQEILVNGEHRKVEVYSEHIEEDDKNLLFICINDITQIKHLEKELNLLRDQLAKTQEDLKAIGGFIPVCSYCKKIRDDKGYWSLFEKYFLDRSINFTHGICPECVEELYPDL